MTSSRAQAVDFTAPIFVDHWGLVCPLQEKSENVIWKPVEDIWAPLLSTKYAWVLFMGLADYVFFGSVNWNYLVGFVHRIMYNQGVENLKDSQLYQKILIIAWALPIFVVAQLYSGTMTALLASSSLQKPIRDRCNSYRVMFNHGHGRSNSAPTGWECRVLHRNWNNGLYGLHWPVRASSSLPFPVRHSAFPAGRKFFKKLEGIYYYSFKDSVSPSSGQLNLSEGKSFLPDLSSKATLQERNTALGMCRTWSVRASTLGASPKGPQ